MKLIIHKGCSTFYGSGIEKLDYGLMKYFYIPIIHDIHNNQLRNMSFDFTHHNVFRWQFTELAPVIEGRWLGA